MPYYKLDTWWQPSSSLAESIEGHLLGDPLILWAINGGHLPQSAGPTDDVFPGDWQQSVLNWIEGGASCNWPMCALAIASAPTNTRLLQDTCRHAQQFALRQRAPAVRKSTDTSRGYSLGVWRGAFPSDGEAQHVRRPLYLVRPRGLASSGPLPCTAKRAG